MALKLLYMGEFARESVADDRYDPDGSESDEGKRYRVIAGDNLKIGAALMPRALLPSPLMFPTPRKQPPTQLPLVLMPPVRPVHRILALPMSRTNHSDFQFSGGRQPFFRRSSAVCRSFSGFGYPVYRIYTDCRADETECGVMHRPQRGFVVDCIWAVEASLLPCRDDEHDIVEDMCRDGHPYTACP